MNTPQKYAVTPTGKLWTLEGMKPSEKVLLLALKIAAHEKRKGVKRDELREATGLPESSFDRAWTYMLKNGLVEQIRRTEARPESVRPGRR